MSEKAAPQKKDRSEPKSASGKDRAEIIKAITEGKSLRSVVTDDLLDKIEAAVAEAEKKTSVEFVVVFAGKSGSYRDIQLIWGMFASLLTLIFILYSPLPFPEAGVIIEMILIFVAVSVLAGWVPGMIRFLVSNQRMATQVAEAAKTAFWDEAVGGTRARTGLLLYVSLLERRVEVLPDFGIQGRADRGAINRIATKLPGFANIREVTPRLITALEDFGNVFHATLPANPEDNPDEIANRPRVRA